MDRPQVSPEELTRPVGVSKPREPLDLLPEREWLNGRISEVKYQVAMFNGAVSYVSYKDDQTGEEVFITDDDGEKIKRMEFEFVFSYDDIFIKEGMPRKQWLRLGASFSERSHLPQFLANVVVDGSPLTTPQEIIDACTGVPIKLQLKNKKNKDGTKTFQNVVWDAVKFREVEEQTEETPPEDGEIQWDE